MRTLGVGTRVAAEYTVHQSVNDLVRDINLLIRVGIRPVLRTKERPDGTIYAIELYTDQDIL